MPKKKFQPSQEEVEIARIRIPKKDEVLGTVELMLGGDKLKVKCDDGNIRICRIPGRLRKRVWIRVGFVNFLYTQGASQADAPMRPAIVPILFDNSLAEIHILLNSG